MAPSWLLLLPLLALVNLGSAAIWSITQYQVVVTTLTSYDTDLTFTRTSTFTLPTPVSVTPTGTAFSTSTSSDDIYDATYSTLYYRPSAVQPSILSPLTTRTGFTYSSSDTITNYVIDRVYTNPPSCRSSFTFTTTSLLLVPSGAETQLKPTSFSTSLGGVYDHVTGYLPADAVNATSTGTSTDFVQSYYINRCSTPYGAGANSPTRYSGGGSYSGGSSSDFDDVNCIGKLCPWWLIYIVTIIPVLVILFLLGLIESYFWFSRLMKGQFALRGVPLFWIAISLWTALCLRRHRAASPEHQPQLLKQWREMSSGTHIKLWLKYGFRHRDPPELAAIIGQSAVVPVWQQFPNAPPPGAQQQPPPPGGAAQPQMAQQAPVYYQQPQQFQGAQVWAPQPQAYDPNNPGAAYPQQPQSYPSSQPVSAYYPPPPGAGSNPSSSPTPQQQPYYPPPQQPGWDANRGISPPVGAGGAAAPSPSEYTPAAAGGPFGTPGQGGIAHAPPQQVGTHSPSPPAGGAPATGGEGAPEVVVQQPKSDSSAPLQPHAQ